MVDETPNTPALDAGLRVRRWLPRGRTLSVEAWRSRHRAFTQLLAAHVLIVPLLALLLGTSWQRAALAGLAVLFPLLAVWIAGRAAIAAWVQSAFAAFGLLTASAMIVNLSGGIMEAHFHFFIILLFLTLYEDWHVFFISTTYVLLHHGLIAYVDPTAVFSHPSALAYPWRWFALHVVLIGAISLGGILSWRLNEQARGASLAAAEQAKLSEERAKASKERLQVRTDELAVANSQLDASMESLRLVNDELRRLDQLKNEFVAMASHELRTPLTSISGFATTLKHRWADLSEDQKQAFVEVIDTESARLGRLIEAMLTVSKIESGHIEANLQRLPLEPLLESALTQTQIDEAQVIDCDQVMVLVDPDHLYQITLNLLTNAQRYGQPPFEITTCLLEESVEIRFRDYGPGVPQDFASQLFDKFSRSDEASSIDGVGLGLAIVRGLAQAQGGEIRYEEPGDGPGACFVLRLRRA